MKIYDESTGKKLTKAQADTEKGYLYGGRRVTGHVEETTEIMEGTDGLRRVVPAHDEYEGCQYYHAYTDEELAAQEETTLEEQVAALTAKVAELTAMLEQKGAD